MQASPAPDDLRADAARNRERVLEVARELLETGDETLPMNLIARRAGVGVGTTRPETPPRWTVEIAERRPTGDDTLCRARPA